MNYKLKSTNDNVTFLLKTGKDFVRNRMTIASAQHLLATGKVKKSNNKDYPICVDDTWYFEGEIVKTKPKKGELE